MNIDTDLKVLFYTGSAFVIQDFGDNGIELDLLELKNQLEDFHYTWDLEIKDKVFYSSVATNKKYQHTPMHLFWEKTPLEQKTVVIRLQQRHSSD